MLWSLAFRHNIWNWNFHGRSRPYQALYRAVFMCPCYIRCKSRSCLKYSIATEWAPGFQAWLDMALQMRFENSHVPTQIFTKAFMAFKCFITHLCLGLFHRPVMFPMMSLYVGLLMKKTFRKTSGQSGTPVLVHSHHCHSVIGTESTRSLIDSIKLYS